MELLMSKNFPSEEKLLNLIRKKKVIAPAQKKSDAAKRAEIFNFLEIGNRLLIILSVCLLTVITIKFYLENKKQPISSALINISSGFETEDISPKETSSVQEGKYQEIIKDRDIFVASWEVKKEDTSLSNGAKPALMEQYKLIGIILDKSPTAIIEDATTKQATFLLKGEKIGEATLLDIQENKVIFQYGNQQFELVR